MLKLSYCDVSQISDEEFLKLYRMTDRSRKDKADRLKREPAKKLTLAAGMLARMGIAEILGIDPKTISFGRDKNGKPYAKDLDIHFSLSHSGTLAVCAISDKPVGVDAEREKDVDPNVAKRLFVGQELEYVFKTEENVSKRIIEVWTKKEAYVKMLGQGVSDFSTFDVFEKKSVQTTQYQDYYISVSVQES